MPEKLNLINPETAEQAMTGDVLADIIDAAETDDELYIMRAGAASAIKITDGEAAQNGTLLPGNVVSMVGYRAIDRIARIRQESSDDARLEFIGKFNVAMSRLRHEKVSDSELHTFLSEFDEWSFSEGMSRGKIYKMFRRSLPVNFDDECRTDLENDKKRLVVSGNSHVTILTKDITVQDLIKIGDIEYQVEAHSSLMRGILESAISARTGIESENPELTERELEVLARVLDMPKTIALELGIAASTVRTHFHNLLGKLGLKNRRELVVFAFNAGLIEVPNSSIRPMAVLTEREADLLINHFAKTYDEAAKVMGVSFDTVRTHWTNIYEKLEVTNRVQAVALALDEEARSYEDVRLA